MAAPNKASSRWGSFLSQAVAGVESRLDNILFEEDSSSSISAPAAQQQPKPQTQAPTPPSAVPAATKATQNASRSSSNSRANDRLQARLAKAMAAKAAQAGSSPRSSVDNASRPSIECKSSESKLAEKDDTSASEFIATEAEKEATSSTPRDETIPTETLESTSETTAEVKSHNEEKDETASTVLSQAEPAAGPAIEANIENGPTALDEEEEATVSSREIEQLKASHQQEIQEYVERIDSLESKLQYLAKSAADFAQKAANAAPSGSMESKLAGKDEKIALLMEEGQKLAAGEQTYRTVIKKLRQQLADAEKQSEELKRTKDKAAAEADALRKRLNSSDEQEKRQEEMRKAATGLQKEVDNLKKEKITRDDTIRKLERDLKTKTEEAGKAAILDKYLTAEREKLKTQEESYTALRAEKEAIEDKAKQDGIEWSEKLDRAVERGRSAENELCVETKAMETRLEIMRTQAEEATSSSGGEAQVKLLRQIETLQSQYASASSNWQSMESSLLAKLSNLEKERDEAQKRESEMRKKARDSTTRARTLDEELQDVQPALAKAREQLDKVRDELAALKTSAKATEEALDQARSDLEREQRAKSRDLAAQQNEWSEAAAAARADNKMDSRPESPSPGHITRTFSTDLASLGGLPLPLSHRQRTTPLSGSIPDTEAARSRRPSAQPPFRLASASPHPGAPPAPFSPFQQPSELSGSNHHLPLSPPAVEESVADDDMVPLQSSPRQQPAADMTSMSTVAAGPSVQLVERMSAAIRRLEAERVAAREEMARVCGQRDEARGDMVGLLKELEGARAAAARVPELEARVGEIDDRYQTTLEMLGEKSELVEELRADVQDVKAMYRELVEQTMK
ncbi:TATA element modulatory factor 1 TATA binding protein [Cordyceps fumosorosea ARSEF 2679]|uniref:TATA element modulatory factor 1 TATA binding protein n=1 Tax=Cordyceps fumosorosea (strain ARSEF 2679) TaxID=1081104 RepID=A0A167WPI9_CORFA|nr:TATA element modulatory factor 1 TATA binding protein [Cordyceps fumosorosea ARSEF 2679]OAA64051.1 TATA element modulatory factor 1 TATA binding protein [Cordyceps fumosorosea ARSEF 2679]